ncbi:hypothetical protein [Piscinibacter koreensis]|uniref:Porin n=1 Tax=Piscinibacter koreensis TaxID=2742824 RepID=A0A7Y6TWG1_9BURK|nr:hypothetical protein [Schlegelella koreensis]NUZ05961.1 hypothetical protein [Schlegelella koreensis]
MPRSLAFRLPARPAARAVASLLLAAAATAHAADGDEGGAIVAPAAHARITFERVKFPGNEKVGLVGTSYLIDVPAVEGLSIGPGVYGAITGRRGGFFTVGGEVAWRKRLVGPLGVEIGYFVGGGGGGSAPQGGGLMLRPHADLVWALGSHAVGLSVSQVSFPNGDIKSTQLGLVLNISDEFRFVRPDRLDQPIGSGGRAGIGFDRIQLVTGFYRTRRATALDGSALPRTIGMVGIRAEQAWGPHAYWGVEAMGAGQRDVAGYAEYLGTVGYESEVVPHSVTLGGRIALGMGGGGRIPVGGGLLAKASLYGVLRLGDDFGLALEGGIVSAPKGDLRAASATASLVWALDGPRSAGTPARPTRTEFSLGVERYDAARKDGSTRPIDAAVLKGDRYLTPNLYLTGQVHAAVTGGAGGYASAYIGGGWRQPIGSRAHVAAEMLAGVAGGGGIDSRGAVIQPMVYAGYQFTPAFGLRVGAGRIRALDGPLNATVLSALLTVTYGVSSGV